MTHSKSKLENIVTLFLSNIFSPRVKRMIFLSSFLAYVQGTNHPDKELLVKLNKLLNLAQLDDAVMAPSMLNQKIWGATLPRDEPLGNSGIMLKELDQIQDYKIFVSQARKISDSVIKNAPEWLRYGSNKQIRSDLITLLTNYKALHVQH